MIPGDDPGIDQQQAPILLPKPDWTDVNIPGQPILPGVALPRTMLVLLRGHRIRAE
jgi:hypothetical protein